MQNRNIEPFIPNAIINSVVKTIFLYFAIFLCTCYAVIFSLMSYVWTLWNSATPSHLGLAGNGEVSLTVMSNQRSLSIWMEVGHREAHPRHVVLSGIFCHASLSKYITGKYTSWICMQAHARHGNWLWLPDKSWRKARWNLGGQMWENWQLRSWRRAAETWTVSPHCLLHRCKT